MFRRRIRFVSSSITLRNKNMSDIDAFLQNVEDISSQTTATITAGVALITSLITIGEKAYPYVIQVINTLIECFTTLGDAYESAVALLEKLRIEVEIKLAEGGIVTTGSLDEFMEAVETMNAKQQAAYKE